MICLNGGSILASTAVPKHAGNKKTRQKYDVLTEAPSQVWHTSLEVWREVGNTLRLREAGGHPEVIHLVA